MSLSRAIIYGNGPSLLTAPLTEPGVARFGVNRSYEHVYAENWVTADARAFANRTAFYQKNDMANSTLHVRGHVFRHVSTEPIHIPEDLYIWQKGPAGQSGSLAMHIAASLGYEKIYLVGMAEARGRRFYEERPPEEGSKEEGYTRETLKQIYEWPKVDWRIWRDGWHDAKEYLTTPSEARAVSKWNSTGRAACVDTHPGKTCSWCE